MAARALLGLTLIQVLSTVALAGPSFDTARIIDDPSLKALLAPCQMAPALSVTLSDGRDAVFSLETTLISFSQPPDVQHVLVLHLVREVDGVRNIVWEQLRTAAGYIGTTFTIHIGPPAYLKDRLKTMDEPAIRYPTLAFELDHAGNDLIWSVVPLAKDPLQMPPPRVELFRLSLAHTSVAIDPDPLRLISRIAADLPQYYAPDEQRNSMPPFDSIACRGSGRADPARFVKPRTERPDGEHWRIVGPGPWGATMLGGNYMMPIAFAPPLKSAGAADAAELLRLAREGDAYARSLAIWELDRRGDPSSLHSIRYLLNDTRAGLPHATVLAISSANLSIRYQHSTQCIVQTVEGQLREVYSRWFALPQLEKYKRDVSSEMLQRKAVDAIRDPVSLASVWVEYARRRTIPEFTTGLGATFPLARKPESFIREGISQLPPDRRFLAMMMVDRTLIFGGKNQIFTDGEHRQVAVSLSENDIENLRTGRLPGQPEPALTFRLPSPDGKEMMTAGEAAALYATRLRGEVE